jgi:uncharacterized RDD family membrane protein YckC
MSAADAAPATELCAPSLRRRLASFIYEGVLLFGIVFGVGLIYGLATQQRHALQGRAGLDATLFTLIGLYFVWCWTRSGQTLPMQTWHIRLVARHGGPVTPGRALARYLASWLWFIPPLLAAHIAGAGSFAVTAAVVLGWIAAYAALACALPGRQFLHDVLCGTRLVTHHPRG